MESNRSASAVLTRESEGGVPMNSEADKGVVGLIYQTWRLFAVCLWTALLLAPPCSAAQARASNDGPSPDEYAIYARLIEHFDDTSAPLVVTAETSVDRDKDVLRNEVLKHSKRELQGLSDTSIAEFKAKNRISRELQRRIDSAIPYVLVSKQKLESLWKECTMPEKRCGWDLFHDEYPKALGIYSFSRVGFDNDQKQALVYVEDRRDWKSGTGYLVFLQKVNGQWNVTKSVVVWMS